MISDPPFSKTFFSVGMAARIRVSSVISNFSFRGTLKSTLTMAFLPEKSYLSINCCIIKLFTF